MPPLPPYSYVPGSIWPHPTRSPQGHLFGKPHDPAVAIDPGDWATSQHYLRGIELFNAGYYWEAHESWEALWHAQGRRGTVALMLKALIKLAAAGVKVREGRLAGVRTHAARAAEILAGLQEDAGRFVLGVDARTLEEQARAMAHQPPRDPNPPGVAAGRVFSFNIEASHRDQDRRSGDCP